MKITEFAAEYVRRHNLKRTPIYSANRFARYLHDADVTTITTGHLTRVKELCQADGLGAWTIRCTLKDLRTLIRASGRDIRIERIRVPEPNPRPTALEQISEIWPRLSDWCRQWFVVAYWTALRLEDSIRLQQSLTGNEAHLEVIANKTGHRQKWPIPEWLRSHLQPVPLPYGNSLHWSGTLVRNALKAASTIGQPVMPNEIRDRSLNEWQKLGVGDIVHGSGLHRLGVMRHYVDRLEQLSAVCDRFPLPSCLIPVANSVDREAELLANFRRLDQQARGVVSSTAAMLAERSA